VTNVPKQRSIYLESGSVPGCVRFQSGNIKFMCVATENALLHNGLKEIAEDRRVAKATVPILRNVE